MKPALDVGCAVKSGEEIERLRGAAALSDPAVLALREAARPGIAACLHDIPFEPLPAA